jgi:hypothetical protein
MKHKSNILLLSFLITIFSCHKNEEFTTTENVDDPPKITISTTHAIHVKDENGKALDEFTATVAGKNINVMNGSIAVFESKLINKYGEQITLIDKLGNVSNLLLSGVENDINYHQLTIFISKNKNTFRPSDNQIFKINEKISLNSIPNSFLDQNVSYTHDVNATYYHIDIQNKDHINGLPNIRKGLSNNGSLHFLNIKDAFYLQLEGNHSNLLEAKLQIKAYDDEIKKGALKLWYCDLDVATWKEVIVSAENNVLEFAYKNAGYYCIASSTPGVYVSGRITYKDNPVSNLNINFKELNSNTLTTASGKWFSFLPTLSEVKSEISSSCNTLEGYNIVTQNNEITNLTWVINENTMPMANIIGLVKDCTGKLKTDFIFKHHISDKNTKYYYMKEKLNLYIPVCEKNDINCSVSDALEIEKSNVISWPVNNIIETGSWFVCNQAQSSFFNVVISGENKVYFDTKSSLYSDGRMELAISESNKKPLIIYAPKNSKGSQNIQNLNIILDEPNFGNIGYQIKCPSSRLGCGFEKFVITHDGSDEDAFIRGHFKGRFWLKEIPSQKAGYQDVEGEFQILKSF